MKFLRGKNIPLITIWRGSGVHFNQGSSIVSQFVLQCLCLCQQDSYFSYMERVQCTVHPVFINNRINCLFVLQLVLFVHLVVWPIDSYLAHHENVMVYISSKGYYQFVSLLICLYVSDDSYKSYRVRVWCTLHPRIINYLIDVLPFVSQPLFLFVSPSVRRYVVGFSLHFCICLIVLSSVFFQLFRLFFCGHLFIFKPFCCAYVSLSIIFVVQSDFRVSVSPSVSFSAFSFGCLSVYISIMS